MLVVTQLFSDSDWSTYDDKTVGFCCMLLRTVKPQPGGAVVLGRADVLVAVVRVLVVPGRRPYTEYMVL